MMGPNDGRHTSLPELDDEFDRFEQLTQNLLKVPKSEIDAERKRQEALKKSSQSKT